MAKALHANREHSIEEVCTSVGVSRATLYRYLGAHTMSEATAPAQPATIESN